MKKKLIVATMTICVMTLSSLTANAYRGGRGGCEQSGWSGYDCGQNEWCGNQFGQNRRGRMSERLGLSEEQQEKIEVIREEERTKIMALREETQDYQEQMRELTDSGSFDEKAIRTIAEEKAKIQVEMAVVRARMHSQIRDIMTPEQQELATKLRSDRFGKRGFRRGGPGRW